MKTKTTSIFLLSTFVLSVLAILVLFLSSKQLTHKYNAFVRLFPPHVVEYLKAIDVTYNSYYIAGWNTDNVYLGNFSAPDHLLIADFHSLDTVHKKIRIEGYNIVGRSVRVSVQAPYFFITDGVLPAIGRGSVDTWRAVRMVTDTVFFNQWVPISKSSFALRSISSMSHENIIGIYPYGDSQLTKFGANLLEKQIDGIFCTDGSLHYSSYLSNLIYVYRYRNSFIRIDTNLNLVFKGKTIDTVAHAKMKVTKLNSENSFTMSTPPLIVNRMSCIDDNLLFIQSSLIARNEDSETFENASVVDVYDLTTGIYKLSFYLHNFNGLKLTDFKVRKNQLTALFENYLVTYELMPDYF